MLTLVKVVLSLCVESFSVHHTVILWRIELKTHMLLIALRLHCKAMEL